MHKSNIENLNRLIDLNLMRMLEALIQTQSVARSGEILGLSQPAASRSVAKLRNALNDPLLVRTSNGYVLTPLAQSLAPLVTKALIAADEVFASKHFEPSLSIRTFRIATTDYGAQAVLIPLTSVLVNSAPKTHILASSWNSETLTDLEKGNIDLALYADDPIPNDFHVSELFIESYTLVVRKSHPLMKFADKSLSKLLLEIGKYKYIVARYPNKHIDMADDVLKRLGAQIGQPTISLPYFSTAPMIIAESDLIMAMPSRIYNRYANQLPIDTIPIPTRTEDFSYRVIWHDRSHRDPSLQWLRKSMKQLFS